MHSWGDGFQYFNDVEKAAGEIGDFCVRWGRINVRQTKEKFGTARVYLSFGIQNLYWLLKPNHCYYRWPKWFRHIDDKIFGSFFDLYYVYKFIQNYQIWIYKKAYERTIKKYPHIKYEILDGADYDDLLKHLYGPKYLNKLRKI